MPGKVKKKWKPDGSIHLEESHWEDKIEPMSKLGIDSPGPLMYPDIDSKFKKLSKYKSYGSVRIAEETRRAMLIGRFIEPHLSHRLPNIIQTPH